MTKRQYVGALVVLAVAGLLGGTLSDWVKGTSAHAQEGVADTIEARQFIVRDESGYARIHIGMSATDSARIRFSGNHGGPKLAIGEAGGHPSLRMYDGPDSFRSPGEAESDALLDSAPRRVSLGTGEDRLPFLRMYDETNTVIWSAP